MIRKSFMQALALAGLMLALPASNQAQTAGPRAMITQAVDEAKLVTLAGNTRPEAKPKNDLGRVADDLHLDMYLELKRSPEQELAAAQFVESLTDKTSPNFHKWITAAEYGRRFGAAATDIAAVSRWLESHGFAVNAVPAHNMVIDFSGNAGQVREALHTEIHNLNVAGKRYFANMSDPRIPAALQPAVAGVVSLSNFRPDPMFVPRSQYSVSQTEQLLVPGDLATIYNLNPAFAGGYTGLGQTIVLVEDTDVYNYPGDWNTFRSTFGLTQYSSGSFTQVHPSGASAGSCSDPGANGDDPEAAIDVEWASAAAPNAAIVLASCSNTTNFGGFVALQNMLTNGGPLPSVVSVSYGQAETNTGAAFNSYIDILYQAAAAEGVSVFVSSGDSAAVASDRGGLEAIYGVNISSFASTPYDVAVGGTDFADSAAGTTNDYWNPINGPNYNSAMSYIPEIPWNNSCGSQVLANYYGYGTTYGSAGFCNAFPYFDSTTGGSGGPSGCATGAPSVTGAVSGTCAGYAKPSWQAVFGNPSDGVRDIPDVSLFASNGWWGHYYVVCLSDQGSSCKGAPSTWAGFGGTSVSAPIMAGIQALINQALGTNNVGNPNPVYYGIARNEYSTAAGRAACNSDTGPAPACSFLDITLGDIEVPCAGAFNCYLDGEALGLLSTSNTSYAPAFTTTPGWDYATGIGSVNAANLLNAFVESVGPYTGPAAPVLESPANNATGVLPEATLNWEASAGATSYDVYFGTAATPPQVANTADIAYTPATLNPGTTYYWAVGARNGSGANASTTWSFTTSCVSALNPSSAAAAAAGGTGTIPVTAPTGCAWTAVSNVAWITVASGASGSGNGTVGYTVAAATGAQRVGTITVAGQTFTVTQTIYPLISTLAGGAMPPTAAPGLSVSIPVSYGVAVDGSGNVYFPGPSLNAVFKADPTGVVTRIAGTGVGGFSGDSGPALSAQLNYPNGVAIDASGNLYIADTYNARVRKVDTSGVITTLAGNGLCCFGGDGGAATGAALDRPYGVAVDLTGNVFIADTGNSLIRKVATNGIIATVAGNGVCCGYSGDGGAATSAQLYDPDGVAVDAAGNVYIADTQNSAIRKVDGSGTITTVAGNGGYGGYGGDGGAATSAELLSPAGVTVDASGNLYIADSGNQRIRKVSAAGIITTVAGNGRSGFSGDGGAATSAEFSYPYGVAVDASGDLFITDGNNARLREVNAAGIVATLVGGAVGDGGLGVFGFLNEPSGVARDNAGNTYIADTRNNRVRKVAANGTITTVAGTGVAGYSGSGSAASSAELNSPQGLALDASGNLYIADTGNYRVRKVDGSGTITTVAGNGKCCRYSGDGGTAANAGIGLPYGVAVDAAGNLYISDAANYVVRKVIASGTITTVAGNGSYGYSGDGGAATSAQFGYPYGLAVDTAGNLYIADTTNHRIRMVAASGIVTTVAGTGTPGFSGDGGPATSANLLDPTGVAVDAAGDLYIADYGNERIREVTSGTIATVAGNGDYGYSGDGGPAPNSSFRRPYAISLDTAGDVAVADRYNGAIRLLTPIGAQPVLAIQSAQAGGFVQGQTGATYTVTVSNAAEAAPSSGITTLTEILPAGLTLESMTGAGWACTAAPTCTRSDALGGGSSYPPIAVTVNVSAAAPSQLTNEVSVTGGGAAAAGIADLTLVSPSNAPPAPVLVSPANGATSVLPTASLTWNASTGATSYDVYFGTASTPPLAKNAIDLNYAPGTLNSSTTYYWAIGARNGAGVGASAVWSFSTACESALNPSSATAPAAGGTGTIPVVAATGCAWTAVSNVVWITIASGASGTGNGTVGYSVAANNGAARAGTITVAGQTFTVMQAMSPLMGQNYLISTLTGGAMPATQAPGASVSIPLSGGVAVDSSGNTYFASPNLNAVFKADPAGVVTRIAGTSLSGYSGDSGPALGAPLNYPNGVAVDASGNVYIADSGNAVIRKVDGSGNITTVAGNGGFGYLGDGGPATSAQIGYPFGIAVDASGNLYISDIINNVIRKVSTTGIIATVAGNGGLGYSGDGGPGPSAQLWFPYGVAVDAAGNVYIADTFNQRIRKVAATGTITTVAGTGRPGFTGDGGAATSATLMYPYGVSADAAGNLYIADGGNSRIRKVNAAKIITTVAGNGSFGYAGDGAAATSAQLNYPKGVAVDASGDLYIADTNNARIREVSAAGTITTTVGGGLGDGGLGVFGSLNLPSAVAGDSAGNIYIADGNNNRVRKVAANGAIATVAGTGISGFSGDGGAAASAQLNSPQGVVLDASGNLYIADSQNSRVRKVDGSGNITTVAGNGKCCGYSGDGGAATGAQIGSPAGLAFDASGNLYIADAANNVIRKVAASGTITTVAGNGTYGYSGDGATATGAQLWSPAGLAVDAAGNLYIADSYNHAIREVSTSGIISTVAGTGMYGFSGDGGPANLAQLDYPTGVAVDAAGDLYIADSGNGRIRKVAAGAIATVAGNDGYGYTGDGGPATTATFQNPYAVFVGPSGAVAVADQGNNAIRLLTLTGVQPVLNIWNQGAGSFTAGLTGEYTLTVNNAATAAATSGSVTVTEIPPTGMTVLAMAGAGWTCGAPAAPTCTRSDALAGGSSYPAITVRVSVSASAPAQSTNQAGVSGGGAATAGAEALSVIAALSGPPPAAPVLSSPGNGATNISKTPSLVWNASAGATSYDVYFGTASALAYAGTTTGSSYSPPALNPGLTYYWQVVAKNGGGTASSAVWSFTTERPRRISAQEK